MNICEECERPGEDEIPRRLVTNQTIEGVLAIERAFSDVHDFVNCLPPLPTTPHGEILDADFDQYGETATRYCACCDEWQHANTPACRACGAPWVKP